MAGQSYSARFMVGRGAARSETYTVPADHRAVVRFFSAIAWTLPAGVSAALVIHGIRSFYFAPTQVGQQFYSDVRYVIYQGETIQWLGYGGDFSYSVSGFLFSDPGGRPDDAGNVIAPLPGAELLPAGSSSG